jgi:hypothetical protein
MGSHPSPKQMMLAELDAQQKTVYSPDRGTTDPRACTCAEGKYGGCWGPFVNVTC